MWDGVQRASVFDGPPGREGGRFVEVEDADGRSVEVGEWVEEPGGTWALVLELAERQVSEALTLSRQWETECQAI
jgi:hypothetical protein